ncbi:MAG TPA: ABC transporter substrate-binding protein [Ktedonobacteraceae bacterium]|jgi:iron complex transport system substrate-binding protein
MRSQVISQRLSALLVLLLLLAACGGQTSTGGNASTPARTSLQPVTTDANGAPIVFPGSAPQHIISLVPSVSEMLGALPLQGRVVAVDYYTNYPATLASLPKISDASARYSIEQILRLHPDLVLTYGNDTKQYDSQLTGLHIAVVNLPSGDLTMVLREILTVGRLTFTQEAAGQLVTHLLQQIAQIKASVAGSGAPTVMIEADDSVPGKPYVFGGGSFGDELVQDANGIDVFHSNTSGGGFPQVTDEAVISANPQFIVLTEDPAFGGDVSAVYRRPNWGTVAAVENRHVIRIATSLIGRPGPRLVEGLQCLAQILHPTKFHAALPAYCSATL